MKKRENMSLITVFTPLFNRRESLKRTYRSLCNQTSKNFVWLIIDDGSTDNPYSLIKQWQETDNGFDIQYVYKSNGGMHTAHNVAYEHITTELNVCIDSDDYMPNNAIELIESCWLSIDDKTKYAGIIALDYADSTKEIIGQYLPFDKDCTTLSGYYRNGGQGDKKLIYRTEIIKRTPPYPVYEGEKFVALAYKYRIIDETYELKILNENVCFVEYQLDGSTANMYRQYVNNPKGFAFWRKFQMTEKGATLKEKLKACVHYVSSSMISKNKKYVKESPLKAMTVFATPFGIALYWFILFKSKKSYMRINGK